jgi:hypothetical protein
LVVMLNAFLCSWLQGICLFIPYISWACSKVKQSTQLETSHERKPDIALGLTATVSQQDQRHTICQSKTNGKTPAPGKLSSQ